MEDIAKLASVPHPVGSMADADARDYIGQQLKTMGLGVTVQSGFAISPIGAFGAAGMVHNVIGRLRGQDSGRPVVLVAHYDSVPTGPGAADNAASVAAILEVMRVLRAQGTPEHDVVAIFTDGEEPGLLGSALAVHAYQGISDASVVVNYDYRGNQGPTMLFETSAGEGTLVRAVAEASPRTVASSAFAEAYHYLPNYTDGTVFLRAGLPLLNFAAIDGSNAYHSAADTADALSRETLREQGEGMLRLVHRATQGLQQDLEPDHLVYFTLPVLGIVSYGMRIAWFLAVAVTLCYCALTWVLVRRNVIRPRVYLSAAAFVPVIVMACVALVAAGWSALRLASGEFGAIMEPHAVILFRSVLAIAMIAVFMLAIAVAQRWVGMDELSIAALGICVIVQLLTMVLFPGASYLFAWPCLFAVAGACGLICPASRACAPLLFAGGVGAAIVLVPFLHALAVGLTLSAPLPVIVLATVGLLLVVPALRYLPSPLTAGAWLACCTVALSACGIHDQRAAARVSTAESLNLITDAEGKSYWTSADAAPGAWTQRFLGSSGVSRIDADLTGFASMPFLVAPATGLPAATQPTLEIKRDTTAAGLRTIDLHIDSMRSAPRMRLTVDGAKVLRSTVQGHSYQPPADRWRLDLFGVEHPGAEIELVVEPGHRVNVRLADMTYGLPVPPAAARTATSMPTPYVISDTWQAVSKLSL